ncbi:hypothetical protein BC828DRAFT_408375 [Blastocladiella britannica]|nr:hypothetical protein BC828DRAFT_408375 [Blastocladiella britannica]
MPPPPALVPCTMLTVPPEFAALSTSRMASLASAIASSVWHSPAETPLQQLELAHAAGTLLHHDDGQSQEGMTHLAHAAGSLVVSVLSVVRTMLAATQLSPVVVLVATLYVSRLRALVRHAVQAPGSELRVLTVALMLAAKWLEDHTYSNASWGLASGMPARDLGIMEFEYLALLQWDLTVAPAQFAAWIGTLTAAAAFVFAAPRVAAAPPKSVSAWSPPSSLSMTQALAPAAFPGSYPDWISSQFALEQQQPITTKHHDEQDKMDDDEEASPAPARQSRLRTASTVMMHALAAASSHGLLPGPCIFDSATGIAMPLPPTASLAPVPPVVAAAFLHRQFASAPVSSYLPGSASVMAAATTSAGAALFSGMVAQYSAGLVVDPVLAAAKFMSQATAPTSTTAATAARAAAVAAAAAAASSMPSVWPMSDYSYGL